MSDLLLPLTLLATIITIITGTITIFGFVQQYRKSRTKTSPKADPLIQPAPYQSTGVGEPPSVLHPATSWPSQPLPNPPAPTPSAPLVHGPMMPSTTASHKPFRLQQAWWRFSPSYPKLTIFALLGQVIWVLFLVLIFIPGPDGSTSLWKTDAVIDVTSTIALLASLITLIGSAVYATIAAARLHRWGWLTGVLLGSFVGSILVPGVPSLVFSLWGPTTRPGQQAYRYLQPSWPDPSKPM